MCSQLNLPMTDFYFLLIINTSIKHQHPGIPLHLHCFESAVLFLELVNLPDEEVSVPAVHLRVCDVDHVLVDVKVHFRLGLELALEPRGALRPDLVHHLVLEAEQVRSPRPE